MQAVTQAKEATAQTSETRDQWRMTTPKRLMELTTAPDRAKAKRAMEAMMTMRKIDIAALEAAVA
jgi:predicted 3-demethylubiquinone-9 3-methyltransferase (glyoxalase superfamily)